MQKVYVAMSGGVDSSVSAAFLKERGYDVTGVFIKTWHPPFLECTWKQERQDAMNVCAHLGIPFKTFDLENEYKKEVVDYMISEYASGRTPNPDVLCNEKIKFGAFFEKALQEGAEYIATGHYARVEQRGAGTRMLAGVDANKDQSYFLWRVPQDVLARTLFPVGALEKHDVRAYANRFGLSVAEKKDSQGVCFLGRVDMKEFLKKFITTSPGDVLNESGESIGTHDGALLYTLGERHGFTITKKTSADTPMYIVAKDVVRNTLTVSSRESMHAVFGSRDIGIEQVHWISDRPSGDKKYTARFRYRQSLQTCSVRFSEEETRVVFDEAQHAIARGQSLVVYDGDVCLGGGVVCSVA